MFPAGTISSGAAASVPSPTIGGLTDPLVATALSGGGVRPITSIRFASNGQILEAIGDTGVALPYNGVGNWLDNIVGLDNTDWEVMVVIDSEDIGDPGTWTGTFGVFLVLSATRTYTWTKDGTGIGTAGSIVTITLRQVSDAGNVAARPNMNYDAIITL